MTKVLIAVLQSTIGVRTLALRYWFSTKSGSVAASYTLDFASLLFVGLKL